jgi:hypothetical protein
MTNVNDASSCSVTLELSIMLLEWSISRQLCSMRIFIAHASLMTIVIYDHHIFIALATEFSQPDSTFLQKIFPNI